MAVAFTKRAPPPHNIYLQQLPYGIFGGEENNFIKSLRLEEKVAQLAVSDEV